MYELVERLAGAVEARVVHHDDLEFGSGELCPMILRLKALEALQQQFFPVVRHDHCRDTAHCVSAFRCKTGWGARCMVPAGMERSPLPIRLQAREQIRAVAAHPRDERALPHGQARVASAQRCEHELHHGRAGLRLRERVFRVRGGDHALDLGSLLGFGQRAALVGDVLDASHKALGIAPRQKLPDLVRVEPPLAVQLAQPPVLLLALAVHVAAVLRVLAFGPCAQEVVVALGNAAHMLDIADDVQVEREVVPEGLGEHDAALSQIRAPVELVPRRVEQLRVEQPMGLLAKLLLRLVHRVRGGAKLPVELVVAIVGVDVEAGHHQIERMLGREPVHVLEHGRLAPVVAVHEVEELARRLGDGGVPGARRAPVPLVDCLGAPVLGSQLVADRPRRVGAAVVDDQQLEILQRLPLQRLHGAAKPRLDIVGGNDDADNRAVRHGRPFHKRASEHAYSQF